MTYIIYLLLILLVLNIAFNQIKDNRIEKIKNDPNNQQILNEVKYFLDDIKNMKNDYFRNSCKIKVIKNYQQLYSKVNNTNINKIKSDEIEEFKRIYSSLDELVDIWNKEYISNELENNKELFNNIDGKSLDAQQRKAVVVDEDSNLVLAGAGSGKTLTISAKVKYLVDVKGVKPEEVLLISFTKKSAEEMNERIYKKLGIKVEAKTFHKLGLDIIKKTRGHRPDICESLDSIIDNYFKEIIYNKENILEQLILFFGYYINIPKGIEEFESIGEYYKYCKGIDFITLKGKHELEKNNKSEEERLKKNKKTIKGEKVKSIEEVIIANYLYLNGIEYIYEDKYPYETGDKYRKIYRPDFYLPKYNIYIEHFGINKDYKAPWLPSIEEQKYIAGITWKRELHKKYKTKLIETYSYYNTDGILVEKLEEKLSSLSVKFKKIDCKDVYDTIFENKEDKYFKELRKLISTFIGLFKSNGYTVSYFDKLNSEIEEIDNNFIKLRNKVFLKIAKSIYEEYQSELDKNNEVDFNDMINESTDIVKSDMIKFEYKYIIIDEYQDISKSRFNLIKEIKRQTNAKLVCVGDDWQSIYRFTGSDVNLFTYFGDFVGYYELLKIEKTYRNSQELIDIAGNFIMKNERQLKKNLRSDKNKDNPIKMIRYSSVYEALDKSINEIISEFGEEAQITILGRNNFDIEILSKENTYGDYSIIRRDGNVFIKSKKHNRLKLNYLTVHKSKGLEADNIIVINLENKTTGFPNQTNDDPILDLVLTHSDRYMFAEERRLFYVALTRTKNRTYLLVPENNSSIFCDELTKDFNIDSETVGYGEIKSKVKCPKCNDGKLVRRTSSKNNSFLGCTNYPLCDFTSNSIEILYNPVVCNVCNGYMVKRFRNNKAFLGCINYPYCNNTQEYLNDELNYNNFNVDCERENYDSLVKREREDYYNTCNDYAETELNAIVDELKYYEVKETELTKELHEECCEYHDSIIKEEEECYYNHNGYAETELNGIINDLKSTQTKELEDDNKNNTLIQENIDNVSYSERIELYIKNDDEKEYKYYKTCTVHTKNKVGDILNIDESEFIVTDKYQNTIFIQDRKHCVKNEKEVIELYIRDEKKDGYVHYKRCITDIYYGIGDIFRERSNYFIIEKISNSNVYIKRLDTVIDYETGKENRILDMHTNTNDSCKYYKKYLTNKVYKPDDKFTDKDKEFLVTNTFKDIIFIELQEESDSDESKNDSLYKGEVLDVIISDEIKRKKEDLLILKNNKYISISKKLWLDGFMKYIEGYNIYDIFNEEEMKKIIYCSRLIREEWILNDSSYITTYDIREYQELLVYIELEIINKQLEEDLVSDLKGELNTEIELNWHMREYSESLDNYDVLNLYPDLKSIVK